jgi:SOS-response transcriptional repressor LexA
MSTLDRDKLRALLAEAGMTPRALSLAIGDNPYTVRDILSGRTRNPRSDTLSAIANALGVGLYDVLEADEFSATSTVTRRLTAPAKIPMLGEVAAGLWRETMLANSQPDEFIALSVDGYDPADLYALRVSGRSMDLIYPPGRCLVVAPVSQSGLRVGDHVIVERTRAGLVEITVKELVMEGGKAWLYPRSSSPEFQTPLLIDGSDLDQDAPRVIGVVVADYVQRQRPTEFFTLPANLQG